VSTVHAMLYRFLASRNNLLSCAPVAIRNSKASYSPFIFDGNP